MTSHLTFALYHLVLEGRLPATTLALLGHDHLTKVCSACQMEWEVLQEKEPADLPLRNPFPEAPPLEALPDDDRHLSYKSLQQRLRRQERRRQQGRMARRHLTALRSVPRGRRGAQIAKARSRYRSRAFAELLIEESRRVVRTDPCEAENLASLVPAVLSRIPASEGRPWLFELAVRSRAWQANAQRVAGDLDAANRTFVSLRHDVQGGQLPPWIRAELASLEASLRMAQRDFPPALAMLTEALELSQEPADRVDRVRYLLKLANLLVLMDRPQEALPHFQQAEDLMGRGPRDPHQDLVLLSGRVVALCDLGREGEIEERFEAFRARHAGTDVLTEAIVEGLRARVKLHRGDAAGAVAGLLEVRRAFLQSDRPYDAALVSFDLAQVYLESGRWEELERLAAELVPQFRARGVARETLAALRLLAEAVAARQVTQELLGRLRGRISPATSPG